MHEAIQQVFRFFARMGAVGLVGLGFLDSSFLFLPLGNDLLLVALTARQPDLFWYYAFMSTLGSVLGVLLTDFLSRKLGEGGLEKLVNPDRVKGVRKRLEKYAWWVLGLAALLPPPFPFTVFVIAAAGLQTPKWHVMSAVGAGRLVRFFVLGLLARQFGKRILEFAEKPEVEFFVIGLALLSIIGSVFSVLKWIRSARGSRPAAVYAQG
jgi:membrane protein YqaA with SNARE-associated domain